MSDFSNTSWYQHYSKNPDTCPKIIPYRKLSELQDAYRKAEIAEEMAGLVEHNPTSETLSDAGSDYVEISPNDGLPELHIVETRMVEAKPAPEDPWVWNKEFRCFTHIKTGETHFPDPKPVAERPYVKGRPVSHPDEEGMTAREIAEANIRNHLKVPRRLTLTQVAEAADFIGWWARHLYEGGKRKPRVFHQSSMLSKDADELSYAMAEFTRDTRILARKMVELGDYDPALEIAQLKEWDGLLAMYERSMFNCAASGTKLKDQIAMLWRTQPAGEILENQVERLEERAAGLRVQYDYFRRKFRAMKLERDRAVQVSGISWHDYTPLAERAKRGVDDRADYERRRFGNLHYLQNVPEAVFRQWMENEKYYTRHSGVDSADGSHTSAAIGLVDE